jgi:hypothetical protein
MITPPTTNPIIWASQSIRPFLPHISVAITSTVLAVFVSNIVRVLAFVALVTFGYGAWKFLES